MFIYFVNEYLDREMSLEEAVAASVKRAKKEGILVDFINKYATEVEGMLTGNNGRGIRRGYEDVRVLTMAKLQKREIEMARAMKNDNKPIDEISKYTGLSTEEIDKL